MFYKTGVSMKKVVILGKPGNGKSALSKQLESVSGLPLHQLDSIFYKPNGEVLDLLTFNGLHENLISSDSWIIEGFGTLETLYQRISAADTVVYIDLPYSVSYWFVTKRLLKSAFVKPEGWPEGCSVLKGTLESYKTLRACPVFWNVQFMKKLEAITLGKSLHVIKSVSELNTFIDKKVNI
jgi:adenylate kinase family enzyme